MPQRLSYPFIRSQELSQLHARLFALSCASLLISSLLLCATTAWAKPAESSHPGVYYSYEKQRLGESERWVLVPKTVSLSDDFETRIKEVLRALRRAKGGSYGQVKIAFRGDEVHMYLDQSKANQFPIVFAELVYSFTENGASSVHFPRVRPKMTRADIPQPAYRLVLPLSAVLSGIGGPSALAKLPNGTLLSVETIQARLAARDRDLVQQSLALLEQPSVQTLKALLKFSETGPLPGIKEAVLKYNVLQSANEEIRLLGIKAMAGIDDKSLNRVLQKMMDEDPSTTVRDTAAKQLSQSSDPRFSTSAQYHALRSQQEEVVLSAIEGLKSARPKEATRRLIGVLGSENTTIRRAALEALVVRGAQRELLKRLDASGDPLARRLEIGVALASAKNRDKASLSKARALILKEGSVDAATQVVQAIATSGAKDRVSQLKAALSHRAPEVRQLTYRVLQETKGRRERPAALKVLAQADVDDWESGEAAWTAIRTLYAGQTLPKLLREMKRIRDAKLRQGAIQAIGLVTSSASGRRYLSRALRELDGFLKGSVSEDRAAAITALGLIGGEEGSTRLTALLADPALPVRRALATTLSRFPATLGAETLTKNLDDADLRLKVRSLESIRALQLSTVGEKLLSPELFGSSEPRLSLSAALALVSIAPKLEGPLMSRALQLAGAELQKEGRPLPFRIACVELLGGLKSPGALIMLETSSTDQARPIRLSVIKALVRHGDANAASALPFQSDDRETRAASLEAAKRLADGGSTQVKTALKRALKTRLRRETDPALKSAMEALLGQL
ncbi:MAG: hypothetical protein VYD19_08510 [Myxococcota bacterium]|nr:hypothetical protein [Myxococcota bacterium]